MNITIIYKIVCFQTATTIAVPATHSEKREVDDGGNQHQSGGSVTTDKDAKDDATSAGQSAPFF